MTEKELMESIGGRLYLFGGAVRDKLLQERIKELRRRFK
jgi:tRNA nucleotidyltransferase/poly(A) polymerase